MQKDLIRIVSNPVLLSSNVKECLTYLKSIGKSMALAATLSDTELEIKSDDSDDKGILSAFTTIVDSTKGIVEVVDEEEDLVESKFEKMDE